MAKKKKPEDENEEEGKEEMNFDEDSFVNMLKDEDTSIADEGASLGECSGWVDTGCYLLNAVLSGSLYGGVSDNRITAFAGKESTGKTFFIVGIIKHFLESRGGAVIYYDTENAINKKMMVDRGINPKKVLIANPNTVQDCKHMMVAKLNQILAIPEAKRPPVMMVIDSVGALSTSKEVEDTKEGKDSRDMTKAPQMGGLMRTVAPLLAKAKIPLLLTNHLYAVIGAYVPTSEMSGGSALRYNCSTICNISKAKDKDGKEVVGNLIRVKMTKSRLSRENREVTLKLSYDTGLDKYYGLLDLAEQGGIIKKVSTQYQFPDGSKAFGKNIYNSPEKYFTPEIMAEIEKFAGSYFLYGSNYDQSIE